MIYHDYLSDEDKTRLLGIAENSIRYGVIHNALGEINNDGWNKHLNDDGACFVTLLKSSQLRGCIGTLEAFQSLAENVHKNAYGSAFKDPRFSPLAESELADLEVKISVLTPNAKMEFTSEQDLLNQLQPGVDGLILEEGYKKGTFLPSVWENLRTPENFLNKLKTKAGLAESYWSDTLTVSRYNSIEFGKAFSLF